MRTGRDTQPVEVTPGMIDNGLAVNDMQCAVRAGLDALTGTTAFSLIDHDLHEDTLNNKRIHPPEHKLTMALTAL